MDKSEAQKATFGVHSIRKFWKISGQSLLWTTIVVHDKVFKVIEKLVEVKSLVAIRVLN